MEKVSDNIDIVKGKKKDKKESEIEEELKNLQLLKMNGKKEKKVMQNFGLKNNMEFSEMDYFDIDNSYYPFIPKITSKPFGLNELSPDIIDARRLRNLNTEKFKTINFHERKINKDMKLFEHPYKDEIILYTNELANRMDKFNYFYSNLKKSQPQQTQLIQFETVSISTYIPSHINTLNMNNFEIMKVTNTMKEKGINSFNELIIHNSNHKDKNEEDGKVFNNLLTLYEIEYLPLQQSKFFYVETHEELKNMINDIESYAEEIAVDLEHHSLESFLGITCLMQISTRLCDYIIDTIKLRCFMQEINRIFCNPNITKVLHGADFDIEWLQKDFGVYIVNMFDTGQAARMLQLPSFSLANLLSSICNISADKKYQLADWRIRPLPAEMLKYAREDTHYLLYIYDDLKKKLIQKSFLKNEEIFLSALKVYKKSNEIALKLYSKPFVKSEEYYQILARNVQLSKFQKSILKLLYKFRDFVARKLDLSSQIALSNRNLFTLCKLPKFDIDTLYMNLDKNAKIRNFIPELAKIIDAKLVRNEKKIDQGNSYKLLETNYINEIKGKLSQSKQIVSQIKSNFEKLNSKNDLNTSQTTSHIINATNKTTNNDFKIIEIKDKGEIINFYEKKNSNFFNDKISNQLERQINTSNHEDYDILINKFDNFKLINFLQDKYPHLKFENKPRQNLLKNNNKITEGSVKDSEMHENQHKQQEIFIGQKRKADEMLDLTDYNRPKVKFSNVENNNSDDDSDYDFKVDDIKEINNMIKFKNTSDKSNQISINMEASENFIKNLINKSGKKKKILK